jgi:hypothetical protein
MISYIYIYIYIYIYLINKGTQTTQTYVENLENDEPWEHKKEKEFLKTPGN